MIVSKNLRLKMNNQNQEEIKIIIQVIFAEPMNYQKMIVNIKV